MITMSIDDGCASDVRAAKLAKAYNIETVFYWPVERHALAYKEGYEPLSGENCIKIARDFEIGSHSISHRLLTRISEEQAKEEIYFSKLYLEGMYSTKITKFCPARGYTNEKLTKFTLDFYDSQRLTKGEGLVHIHPNSGVNGDKHWMECVDENTKEIWGHGWEIDRFNEWDNLEKVLREYTHR